MEDRDRTGYAGCSDEELLERAKKDEKAAFGIFYDRHKRRILNYAYRMIGSREATEEITQDVFIRGYINLKRYIPQGRPLSWLYTIAGNLCRNYIRKRRYEPSLFLDRELPQKGGLSFKDIIPAEGANPADSAVSKEAEEIVQKYISQLPVKYREVLIICDIQGYSYEEAARILRCRIGTVCSRLSRARAILAKRLKGLMRD